MIKTKDHAQEIERLKATNKSLRLTIKVYEEQFAEKISELKVKFENDIYAARQAIEEALDRDVKIILDKVVYEKVVEGSGRSKFWTHNFVKDLLEFIEKNHSAKAIKEPPRDREMTYEEYIWLCSGEFRVECPLCHATTQSGEAWKFPGGLWQHLYGEKRNLPCSVFEELSKLYK